MASSKVCLAALCSLVILSTFIGSTQSASCCLMYTRRHPPCNRVMGYTVQNINTSCDIPAVIFHLPARFLCANPSDAWTQKVLKCLDERKKNNNQILRSRTPGNTTSA
ncbi:C-C motif chemokine 20b [Centropristis striata]|uniref:C-C motif chemokine 20b n=1 Tax=Centropristis striata TaxID=184440 RepID=UPI0027E00A76|nr:C-C motif chemokine 20b [Centropristis striata]